MTENGYKERWWYLLLACVLFVFTFPDPNPVFVPGIDGCMPWVFNYLFDGHLELGRHIIFPHGPLAFVLYPVPFGINLELALAFRLGLTLLFCYNFFRLVRPQRWFAIILTFLLLWLLLSLCNFQLLFISAVLSCYLLNIGDKSEFVFQAVCGLLLAAMALFIKSYVGIILAILSFSFIAIHVFLRKNFLRPLLYCGVYLAGISGVWYLMYQSFNGLPRYFKGISELASDNSEAAAYYPPNNWWYLGISITLFLMVPLIYGSRKVWVFYGLVSLAVFAAWKHGMARQDIFHAGQLFSFLGLVFGFMVAFYQRHRWATILIAAGSLGFFFVNMKPVLGYENFRIDPWKADNFWQVFGNFSGYKESSLRFSERAVATQKLSPDLLKIIGNETVDIYPWDYTYIPANDLNWHPRPVLQSYAAYTSWLDGENARHFASENAPHFLIWELQPPTRSLYNEELASVDDRHLFNDEPKTVLSILRHYKIKYKNHRAVLFEKRSNSAIIKVSEVGSKTMAWGQWSALPAHASGLLRARIQVEKNIMGRTKGFLYKGEMTYVSYKLENGDVLRYRIVPKNAKDGVWIDPLPVNFSDDYCPPRVTAIQFQSSNKSLMKPGIKLIWEQITIETDQVWQPQTSHCPANAEVLALLGKDHPVNLESILDSTYSFENKANPPARFGLRQDSLSLKAHSVPSGAFSPGFQIPLDSLPVEGSFKQLILTASLQAMASAYEPALLVISLDRDGKSLYWEQVVLGNFVIAEDRFNHVLLKRAIGHDLLKKAEGATLKVFVWNVNDTEVWIRGFSLRAEWQGQKKGGS